MLICIEGLSFLEKNGKWKEALYLLKTLASQNKCISDYAIRYIFECWFVLTNIDCIDTNEKIEYEEIQRLLIASTEENDLIYMNDAKYLFITGFIMQMEPYPFVIYNSPYEEISQNGLVRMQKALRLQPENALFSVLYHGFSFNQHDFTTFRAPFIESISNLRWDDTEISTYFKNIALASF